MLDTWKDGADSNHAAEGKSSLHRDAFLRPSLAASLHCSPPKRMTDVT